MDRTRNILGLTLLALLLTSCSWTSTNESSVTNNGPIYGVDCSGTAGSMSTCYEKAKAMCPNGYNVISKQETQPPPQGNTLLTQPGMANPANSLYVKRNIVINCR